MGQQRRQRHVAREVPVNQKGMQYQVDPVSLVHTAGTLDTVLQSLSFLNCIPVLCSYNN